MSAQNNSSILKNVILVASSNIVTVLSGVLVGFILPLILGKTDYGYYKIFTLYASYVGLFHFGFCDGIYLYYAGKKYDELDKTKFRTFTKFLFYLESIIAFLIIIISLLVLQNDYRFIFIAIAITLLTNNMINYYQFVSQVTYRFKEMSLLNFIRTFLTIVAVAVLFALYQFYNQTIIYQLYVILYCFIYLIIMIWYIYRYRDITFGSKTPFNKEYKEIQSLFKIGFPLLLSNLVGTFILNIDRQFVSLLFDINSYSSYAFAYSMLNLVSIAIAAISTVLYPSLKNQNESNLSKLYNDLNAIILIIVSFCLLGYYPLVFIVNTFLKDYTSSLIIFRIVYPGLLFTSSITIIMANYYKSLNQVKLYFIISVVVLLLSIGANLIAYYLFYSMEAISIASIIVIFIWYLITEYFIKKRFKIHTIKNTIYLLLISVVYYAITYLVNNIIIGFFLLIILILIITFICQKDVIKKILKKEISLK